MADSQKDKGIPQIVFCCAGNGNAGCKELCRLKKGKQLTDRILVCTECK